MRVRGKANGPDIDRGANLKVQSANEHEGNLKLDEGPTFVHIYSFCTQLNTVHAQGDPRFVHLELGAPGNAKFSKGRNRNPKLTRRKATATKQDLYTQYL